MAKEQASFDKTVTLSMDEAKLVCRALATLKQVRVRAARKARQDGLMQVAEEFDKEVVGCDFVAQKF